MHTTATATATTDLLNRAEHAALAIADTWDAARAARLVTLAERYAVRAVDIALAETPFTASAETPFTATAYRARSVVRTAAAARRQARVLARSLELGQGPTA